MTPRVLVVGAGAVGQVYGRVFLKAGAEVSFFVKPNHVLPEELTLFPQAGSGEAVRGFGVVRSAGEAAAQRWDQVWLTVPTDALSGPWLPSLLEATGDATIVALAVEGQELLPEVRRVLGAIPFMAWQAPLPGEQGEAGVAFWVPPLARVPVSGPPARVGPVLDLLEAGGLPGRRVADAAQDAAPVTALLMATVTALEGAGWKLKAFRGRWSALAAGTAREALDLARASPVFKLAAQGWVLRLVLWVGARLLPFDLENYLRYHFTKVGVQSRILLHNWISEGRTRRLPTSHIEKTAALLEPSALSSR